MDYINILGVRISVVNLNKACLFIEECIKQRKKTYICVAPVATIVDCWQDKEYLKIVNEAGMTTPDGIPIVWLGKLRGEKNIERTYGPDLMHALCDLSQQRGYRHYFLGGAPEKNGLLVEKLKARFPKLEIAGSYAPPVRSIGEIEEDSVLDQINEANPDILWVGLGSPKQDYWMYNHRGRLDVPIMIGVGAAFDFIAGTKRQAPVWMRKAGLEWFFRLCCEPRRLWRRYLIGNSRFIWYLFQDSLKNRGKKYDS